jgi:type IV pilus assembly protein PilP
MVFILTMTLLGCSDSQKLNDLHQYIAKMKKAITKHPRKNILDDIQFPTPVQFQAAEKKRDPFEDEQASYGGTAELNNPLTSFPVKSFEFVGTITRNKQTWAIIKAPDNKIYQITIKDRIGNHYGRIVQIYPDNIKIEEELPTQEGGVPGQGKIKQIVTLQLKGGN